MIRDIRINIPSGEKPIVEYGRDFCVQGEIYSDSVLPDDAIVRVSLIDSKGNEIRHAVQEQKNNKKLYIKHPLFTGYPKELDPDDEKLKDFGFPELLVEDMDDPEKSFHDATIKCWYSDEQFKAIIISATDVKNGAIFDNGIGFYDEYGNPYKILPEGEYTIDVSIMCKSTVGENICNTKADLLAKCQKKINIKKNTTQTIVRFNPPSHKKKMKKWCEDMSFSMVNDPLPGYLDPYLGKWLYHMGLLPVYRANDIALYKYSHVYMFIYLIDIDSTSYETELAYLMTQRAVEDSSRFTAYYYDIGEACIYLGKDRFLSGKIRKFKNDEYLVITRVDEVNDQAVENCFNLNGESVKKYFCDLADISIRHDTTIAITGVVRPWQMPVECFCLRPDNTYIVKDYVKDIYYSIDDGNSIVVEKRKLLMERIDEKPIGRSVYEFYNLFYIPEKYAGKNIKIDIYAGDSNGKKENAVSHLCIKVE